MRELVEQRILELVDIVDQGSAEHVMSTLGYRNRWCLDTFFDHLPEALDQATDARVLEVYDLMAVPQSHWCA